MRATLTQAPAKWFHSPQAAYAFAKNCLPYYHQVSEEKLAVGQ